MCGSASKNIGCSNCSGLSAPGAPAMASEHLLLRQAVVSGSGLVYWVGVLIQARRVRRQIGRAPNLRPRGSNEKLLWAGWMVVIGVWLVQPLLVGNGSVVPGLTLMSPLLHPLS